MSQALRRIFNLQWFGGSKTALASTTPNFHKGYNAAREEQRVTLSDGRILGFAEYGNPAGTPIFYIPGSPGSRYDGTIFKCLDKLNIRLICPDRPGQGLSTFQPHRVLSDFPKDISKLAKHLGIPKYHVLGHSGGGPYAVACAYRSPERELLTASVFAGMGPPEALYNLDCDWRTYSLLFLSKWTPSLLHWIFFLTLRDPANLEQIIEKPELLKATEEDFIYLTSPEDKQAIRATLHTVYSQGPAGVIQDLQIYRNWDFELKDVQRKVKLFWGLKDRNAPPSHGRYYQEHLPNSELFEYEGMTHFNTVKYEEDIFQKILQS